MGVTYCKKAHSFQMDSHTCTTFTAKVNHEPKVNCLTGKKGAWQWEWPVTKRRVTSKRIHVSCPNFVETHTHTHTFIGHGLPFLYTLAPPPFITH